jgi:hypothetical protein
VHEHDDVASLILTGESSSPCCLEAVGVTEHHQGAARLRNLARRRPNLHAAGSCRRPDDVLKGEANLSKAASRRFDDDRGDGGAADEGQRITFPGAAERLSRGCLRMLLSLSRSASLGPLGHACAEVSVDLAPVVDHS